MKTIEAIIERAKDGTYSVYCINEMFTCIPKLALAAAVLHFAPLIEGFYPIQHQ
jgi:hypothetical protein